MKHDVQSDNIIRQEIDAELSFLDSRPSLHYDIMREIKGERKVKKKFSLGLVLVLILVLLTGTVAVAVTYRGVSYFLVEKTNETNDLDPDYLVGHLEQYHTSKLLNATAVDAYWDGLELSIAYHIAPVDPTQVIRMACGYPEHDHYTAVDDADILLQEPDFINVTSRIDGELTRPLSVSCNWVYEEDGAISAVVTFPHDDMSESEWISIPIFTTLTGTGQRNPSMLHCDPTILADPIPEHEHQWTEATCVSRQVCTVCQRSEGELGYHNFLPAADGETVACAHCGKELNRPVNIPSGNVLHPGDNDVFVLALQLRLSEMGYYSGSFSGVYTEETAAAVKAWQESHGLEADGVCREDMVELLFP